MNYKVAMFLHRRKLAAEIGGVIKSRAETDMKVSMTSKFKSVGYTAVLH